MVYEFQIRTGKILIDHHLCESCTTYDCVKACSLYGRNILRLRNKKPVTILPQEEIVRRDNECLACEIHCPFEAIKIILPFEELDRLKGDA
jgi:ferredoxin